MYKRPLRKLNFRNRAAAVVFSVLLIISVSFIYAPVTLADEGTDLGQVTEEPQQTEAPQADEASAPEKPQTQEPSNGDKVLGTMADGKKIIEVDGEPCVADEVIVKFKDSMTASSINNALESKDSEVKEDMSEDDVVLTDVPQGETVSSFIDKMEDVPGVEYVQPNYVYTIDKTVNDPYASSGSSLYQWYLKTIDAYGAWDITMGSSDIKVADLDTGIDLTHTEFSGKIAAQKDFVNDDDEAQDDNWHGTFTAGIIAANADNGVGIAGIAPGVQLIIAKVLDSKGSGTTDDVVKAIHFAVDNGADVINMSFGGEGKDDSMEDAIDYAVSKGVVCVAAAGNEGSTKYTSPSDFASCISVIATDKYNAKASYSNYGYNKDISAPGSEVSSTLCDGRYGLGNGTSFAAPMVSASAALILSANPDLSVSEVKDILYSTATCIGKSYYYGHGLLNVSKAVKKAAAPTVKAVSAGYNSINLTWSPVPSADGYDIWRYKEGGSSYSYVCSLGDTSYTDTGLKAGTTYYYKVKAYFTEGTDTVYSSYSHYTYAKPLPIAPASVSAKAKSYSSIRISWSAAEGATGYKVYRASSSGGSYSLIKITNGLSYTDGGLKTGKTYYYKVRSYTSSTKYYGRASSIVNAKPVLAVISWANAFSYSPTSVSLDWSSVPGKSGYEVFRSLESGGVFTKIKTTTSSSYKNTSRVPGRTYYYKIRPYRVVSGKKVYGEYTSEISATPVLGNVSEVSAIVYSPITNKILWKPVSGCSGYEVVSCDSGGGSIKHIKYTSGKYYYHTGLESGRDYYYKVRAYVTVNYVKYFSEYSPVVSVE